MKIAGLDIGTTGCKCTVFDENGCYLGKAYRDYPVTRSISGHEIDMNDLWNSVLETITEMAAAYPDIAGIGVTSFGETFVMTDAEGVPLHKAMLYTDPRGHEECRELCDKIGEEALAEISGLRPHEMYSLPKCMWIRNHRPEVYQDAVHIFQVEDYVVFRLTGIAQIDYSLATRTLGFDIHSLEWNPAVFEAAGIDQSLFSRPVPTGTAAGKVTDKVAAVTGLSRETVIVSISQDQVAAAVGAGAFDSSVAVDGAGTVQCLTPVFDEMPVIRVMYQGYYNVVPYVIPGKYVCYAFSYTGGALTQWCTQTLTKLEKLVAEEKEISVNTLLEEDYLHKRGDEPSGLLVLPHFAGAATPYMDTGSRGAILGLTTDTTAAEIYRGCLEGVAYEMYLNYRHLQGTGITFNHLNATGGGAHSAMWMQIKADVLNLPITALKTVDAGTVGSAMLTGMAIGVFQNLAEASDKMVEKTVTYYPRPEMHEKYQKIFESYEKVYDAVRPLMVR